jgi:hypothetical protein
MSSPRIKNISLNTSGKSPLVIRPSHATRGVRTSRTRGGMRWTRQRRVRNGIAGRNELRERLPACGRTALKTVFDETHRIGTRSGESFGEMGADGEVVLSRRPQAGVKSCGDASGSTGLDVSSIRKATVARA